MGLRDPVGTAAAIASRRNRIPYILEPVGMHRRRLRSERLKWVFDRMLGERVVGGASSVIATSHIERRELEADGVDGRAIVLRPNGIYVEDLLPLPRRGNFRSWRGIPADAPLVVSLGRIAAKKGLPDLVRAVGELPGVWFAVAGPDDGDGTVRKLRRACDIAGLADRGVVHARGLWGRQKAELLADADVFALPSATENFGNAAAEAAAVGVPVLVSTECGVAEWLTGPGVRVVPHGEVAAIRDALVALLDERATSAAREAAPRVRADLSWKALAWSQADIYRDVIEASGV
jgi:glycosyltransferase involved in cell wall biosynthesis